MKGLKPSSLLLRPYIYEVLQDGKWHEKSDIVYTVLDKSGVRSTPEITKVLSGLLCAKLIERKEAGRKICYRLKV